MASVPLDAWRFLVVLPTNLLRRSIDIIYRLTEFILLAKNSKPLKVNPCLEGLLPGIANYNWIYHQMGQENSWNAMVQVMFQSHSVIISTIVVYAILLYDWVREHDWGTLILQCTDEYTNLSTTIQYSETYVIKWKTDLNWRVELVYASYTFMDNNNWTGGQ